MSIETIYQGLAKIYVELKKFIDPYTDFWAYDECEELAIELKKIELPADQTVHELYADCLLLMASTTYADVWGLIDKIKQLADSPYTSIQLKLLSFLLDDISKLGKKIDELIFVDEAENVVDPLHLLIFEFKNHEEQTFKKYYLESLFNLIMNHVREPDRDHEFFKALVEFGEEAEKKGKNADLIIYIGYLLKLAMFYEISDISHWLSVMILDLKKHDKYFSLACTSISMHEGSARFKQIEFDQLSNTLGLSKNQVSSRNERLAPKTQIRNFVKALNCKLTDLSIESKIKDGKLIELSITDRYPRKIITNLKIFENFVDLEDLDLDGFDMSNLDGNIFPKLNNLKSLALTNCKISSLPNGAFQQLESLKQLTLNDNFLKSLPSNYFVGLENLETLYLDGAGITEFHEDVFHDLVNLEFIGLCSNRFIELPSGLFMHNHKLRILRIYGNSLLTSIPDNIFETNLNLTKIELRGSKIGSLPNSLFRLDKLEHLDLRNCIELPAELNIRFGTHAMVQNFLESNKT